MKTDDTSPLLFDRRRALVLVGGATLATLVGCSNKDKATPSDAASSSPSDCSEIPAETAGPFPADGTNGPDVRTMDGIVRQDIRSSFGASSTTAAGIPRTIDLAIGDADGCTSLDGAAVYLWHCDREGRYSLYSRGATAENYLRGIQAAGDDGKLRFTSIFPACYPGRWPHIHFEVFSSLADATGSASPIATSQIALPEATCKEAFATTGYEQSISTLSQTSLTRDGVFGDDQAEHQLPSVSGDPSSGYTIELTVPV